LSITATEYEYVAALLRERCAVSLDASQQYLVESRLLPIARASGAASVSALITRLRRDRSGPLHTAVVEAMTIQETSFFRDSHPFAALKDKVVPDLMRRRKSERALMFWSAACANGQEPYSLAMLLLEHFPSLARWRVRILATDVSGAAISKAEAGRYSQLEVRRGVPASYLSRFFEPAADGCYVVRESVRAMIDWKQLNLAAQWPPLPLFDLILLRNVLIYFSAAKRSEVLKSVRKVMRGDGYLLLGSTETAFGSNAGFEPVLVAKTTLYRPTQVER
jgi:chemotaxis protein methyltransferase CheR